MLENSFTYTKRIASVVANLRKEARQEQKNLVVSCAVAGLFDGVFAEDDIVDAIISGRLPEGWSCHHIVPLSGGGLNNWNNMCFLPRDFHDQVELVYASLVKGVQVGYSVELPFLGLNSGAKVFVVETPEFKEYMHDIGPEQRYAMSEILRNDELNKAARRRMEENAKYHDPNGVALGNRSKSNFAQKNARNNVTRAIASSVKNCRTY